MSLSDPYHLGRRLAPPAFVVFTVVLLVLGSGLGLSIGRARGVMIAFDVAALIFFWMTRKLFNRRAIDIRKYAADNDANRTLLLILTGVVMLVILVSVYSELRGKSSAVDIGLAVLSLVCAWFFSNLVYTFHYAHIFYMDGDDGEAARGLEFPDTAKPVYWDFMYFSFTLGMTFQTSDVSIKTTDMRKVVIGHCLAAFVFNLGVLAFTINTIGNGG